MNWHRYLVDFAELREAMTVLVRSMLLLSAITAWGFLGVIVGHWVTTWEPYMATPGRIIAAVVVLLATAGGLFCGVGLIAMQAAGLKP